MKKKAWTGRFTKETDKLVEEYTASIQFDKRLYCEDIMGSIAHCQMLAKTGIIKKSESLKIVKGLKSIQKEIESGKFKFSAAKEDIHMNIESRLIEKIGSVGGKLHTARSRNDQVALDLKMYLKKEASEIVALLDVFQKSILSCAEKYFGIIMPGYTHLQMAQPVLFSHHMLAYYEMIQRDKERFCDAIKRMDVMPLGSAALAGTNYSIDRKYTASLLNFSKITNNSIDGVGDRDFAIEFLSCSSITMMHLSRLSEELILWSSSEFGFINIDDSFCTGSSIMPQKKNPDVPELVRGKTGRVYGTLMSLLTTMKSLPLAYNKDLQEDKEPVFDTVDTMKHTLVIYSAMMKKININKEVLKNSVKNGYMTAVDLADYLSLKGLPFRDAHEITGKVVGYCIKKKKRLDELTIEELCSFHKLFDKTVFNFIKIENSVKNKDIVGGTSHKQVKKRLSELNKKK